MRPFLLVEHRSIEWQCDRENKCTPSAKVTLDGSPSLPHLARLGRVRTWKSVHKADWSPTFDYEPTFNVTGTS